MILIVVEVFSSFILLEACTQEDVALSLPQNNTVSNANKVSAVRQAETPNTEDVCESYLATSTYKICVPQGALDNKEKELTVPAILSKERSSELQDTLDQSSFSYPKMPQYPQVEIVEKTQESNIDQSSIFISPFSTL